MANRGVLGPAAAALLWVAAALAGSAAHAQDRPAGDFDYYVLALSWSPSWCEAEGDARARDDDDAAAQCADGAGRGFTLHGLWPQYERGWPDWCRTDARDPSRAETAAMADIMGSGGLAWHQWKKHGRCSGLASRDYFALSRLAYDQARRPDVFRRLPRDVDLDASVVEAAFLEADPRLSPDGVTVTCRDGRIQEVRICLTRELEPRACGPDVRRDCSGAAEMPAVR